MVSKRVLGTEFKKKIQKSVTSVLLMLMMRNTKSYIHIMIKTNNKLYLFMLL